MRKTPSSLKGLAENRARLAGDIEVRSAERPWSSSAKLLFSPFGPASSPGVLNRAVSEEAAPDLRVRRRGIGVQNAPGFSDEPS